MVEIRCPYCGGLVRAEGSAAYQRVSCPACGHSVPVPGHRCGDPQHGDPPVGDDLPDDAKDWASQSNKEIAAQLLGPRRSPEDRNAWALKMLLSPFLPHCDGLALFGVSLALLLLVVIDGATRQDLPTAFHALGWYGAPLLLLFLLFGMACSLISVFLRGNRPEFVKWAMLVFAMYVTAGTGVYAGWLMLGRSPIWLMAFPAWNTVNGLVLLVLFRARAVDTECILDEEATLSSIVVVALAVFLLVTTCRYLFGLPWATTASIAVAYTMNLHHALRRHIGPAFLGTRKDR